MAITLTDLTNLFGLLEFYRSSRAKGLKPIIGSEVNVAKDSESLVAPIVLIAKKNRVISISLNLYLRHM